MLRVFFLAEFGVLTCIHQGLERCGVAHFHLNDPTLFIRARIYQTRGAIELFVDMGHCPRNRRVNITGGFDTLNCPKGAALRDGCSLFWQFDIDYIA